jgi:hypothetical protein
VLSKGVLSAFGALVGLFSAKGNGRTDLNQKPESHSVLITHYCGTLHRTSVVKFFRCINWRGRQQKLTTKQS